MRDLFVATIVLGVLPFVLKRPFLGVLLMAWLGYMNPHRLCYGFMLSFPVVQTVAIFTLAGMLISKEAKRLVWSREVIALLAFVVWMGVSTILAFYPGLALIEYERFVKIQILTFMTLMLLTSPQRVTLFAQDLEVDAVHVAVIVGHRRIALEDLCMKHPPTAAEHAVVGHVEGHPPRIDPAHR